MNRSFIYLGLIGGCLLGVIAVWLARDEPVLLYSIDVNEYVPMPEGGAERFERLLALSQMGIDYEGLPREHNDWRKATQDDPDRHRLFVLEHRETILKNYSAIQSVIPDLYELAEAGAIGDTTVGIDLKLLRFVTMRSLTAAVNFHTRLSVWDPTLEPHLGDLLALNQMIRNWAPNTRVLVHGMIAVVIMKENLETLERILSELSAEELVRVRAAIGEPVNLVTVTANALWGDYCSTAIGIDTAMEGQQNALTFFFYQRHRTLNVYGNYVHLVIQNAEDGEWDQMKEGAERTLTALENGKVRNVIGWRFLQMAVPAVQKAFETADEVNQKQDTLLRRIDELLLAEEF